jgi:DNA topoisomerase I
MNLMIVESPNKIKKIKAILGSGWDVAASVGHIRDLPENDFGIEPDTYRLEYQLLERSKPVVSQLRQRAAHAEQVYLATDPDREGEAIACHLQQVLNLRRYARVTFDAITESVIRAALKAPRQLNTNLVHAQEARRGADRLVGYQVSPALSRQTGIAPLSAGRVQSVALRLVVDRQREIEAFKETKHFGAEAVFDGGKWRAQWDTAPFLKEGEEYILDAGLAEEAAKCRLFTVTAAATKPAAKAPTPPFTTATLLQAASVTLGYKPEQTAQIAQRLFEEGLITYHRTDSQNFSAEALAEIRAYAASNNLSLPPKARTWKSKESAQEAHEAIRPTHLEQRNAGADDDQKMLYDLIWTRAVASQLADAEYSVNTLTLAAQDGSQPLVFKAMGRTLIKPGWRTLTAKDAAEEPDPNDTEDTHIGTRKNGQRPGSVLQLRWRRLTRKPPAGNCSRNGNKRRFLRVVLGQLIEQHHIEQRLIHLDAAVVIDKAQLAKAIHKEADTGPRGADHLRQGFLGNGRNEGFRFTRLAEFRHQQENPRQALFAGVEKLIDKIGLGSHAAGQQESQKEIGERRFVMHYAAHLLPCYLKRHARVDGRCRRQTQSGYRRERLLSNEVAGGEKRDCGLFAVLRNDGEFCPAALKIED